MLKNIIFLFLNMLIVLPALAATEWINGELMRVDLVHRKAIIKHDYIPSIKMEAMTMPFKVGNKVVLEKFQAGDKVRFEVQLIDGDLDIKAMEKR